MTYTIFARFDEVGRYVATGTVPGDSPTLLEADVYIGEVNPDTQYHTENGPVDMPIRPTEFHDWDWTVKEWIANIDKLREVRKSEIEAERDHRLIEPTIEYDGIVLDADPLSKQNLQDKITATTSRIARGEPTPPEMLVWKDNSNQYHTFSSLSEYKDWLEGFVIALENRGMAAWSWSWQMKDQLSQLTTFEEVLNFTV
jgi:hypothetical protein